MADNNLSSDTGWGILSTSSVKGVGNDAGTREAPAKARRRARATEPAEEQAAEPEKKPEHQLDRLA